MNLHEYQAKQLFAEFGIPVPRRPVAAGAAEAQDAARELGGGGGSSRPRYTPAAEARVAAYVLVDSAEAVARERGVCSGAGWSRRRPAPDGLRSTGAGSSSRPRSPASSTWACSSTAARERILSWPPPAGGMDIEDIAATQPERIFTAHVDPAAGLQPYQCRGVSASGSG